MWGIILLLTKLRGQASPQTMGEVTVRNRQHNQNEGRPGAPEGLAGFRKASTGTFGRLQREPRPQSSRVTLPFGSYPGGHPLFRCLEGPAPCPLSGTLVSGSQAIPPSGAEPPRQAPLCSSSSSPQMTEASGQDRSVTRSPWHPASPPCRPVGSHQAVALLWPWSLALEDSCPELRSRGWGRMERDEPLGAPR